MACLPWPQKKDLTTLTVNPSFFDLLKSPIMLLAFGFGSGLSRVAPGTVGTLMAAVLWLFLVQLPTLLYLVAVLLCALLGIYICGEAAKRLNEHDHGGIVWDEFVGLWIALATIPPDWSALMVGVVLFRFFDIAKPWPIRWIDGNVHGGFGIMIDDVIAGLATLCCIQLIVLYGWL